MYNTYLSKVLEISENNIVKMELYNPNHWSIKTIIDVDLNSDDIKFYDKKIQHKEEFLKLNKKEISELEKEFNDIIKKEKKRN